MSAQARAGSPRPPDTQGVSGGELLLLVGIAGLMAIAVALWLWAGVAGAVFGDGWPSLSLGDYIGVAARWPSHVGDPRAAFPREARAGLPGLGGFLGAALLVAAALAACATVAWLVGRRLGVANPLRGRRSGASWARGADVRELAVRGVERDRVGLGRVGGRLVAADAGRSVIVMAPTLSGKTTGLAVPALLEWEGPVLATSVKTDLVHDTLARRRELGEVKVFDPTAVTGLARASWTPLDGCDDWQTARQVADRLARAAQPSAGAEAEFWARSGARYLAPLMFAAARSGRSMGDVAAWVNTEEQDDVEVALGASDGEVAGAGDAQGCRAALDTLRSIWASDDRLRSSLTATAAVALDAYGDPTVVECSRYADLTARWLLSGGANTAYLCATADEQERLAPLFVTLISEVRAAVYRRAAETGKAIEPRLLMVLDEAANIAPLPDLHTIAATGGGQGLQLVTVVQDLAQMEARWPGRAETVVNNHGAKIVGSGISCAKTLDYFARMLGDEEIRQVSTSTADEPGRGGSRTESSTWRAIAPANVLREARQGTGVLVYGNLPPARLKLRPWYADRGLSRLAEGRRAA